MAKKETDAAIATEPEADAAVAITTGDYFDAIASAMREAGIENPRELPDVAVDAVKASFGK